jgi:hypothetical protein
MRTIYEGQRVLVECEFRLEGVPTDPIVVQAVVKNPVTGVETTLTYPAVSLTRRDLGLFEASIDVTAPGVWWVRWLGAGNVDAVTEVAIEVAASAMA